MEPRAIRLCISIAMILGAALLRVLPHPPNVAPMVAMGLFAGAHIRLKWPAWIIPLGAMLVSDLLYQLYWGWGLHVHMPAVYLSLALTTWLGRNLGNRAWWHSLPTAATGSLLFFVVTNFSVWALGQTYPHNWSGLTQCYLMALPFLRNALAGDLFYTAAMFGAFAWLSHFYGIHSKTEASQHHALNESV